ncbi:hypothetical protein [Paraburkholderia sp. GAS38]|uniref:hypothetical protein n=1 Tax=Paraburkholderia sp. GAS38 TaxID=3035133 RepID=UPI003D1D885C
MYFSNEATVELDGIATMIATPATGLQVCAREHFPAKQNALDFEDVAAAPPAHPRRNTSPQIKVNVPSLSFISDFWPLTTTPVAGFAEFGAIHASGAKRARSPRL